MRQSSVISRHDLWAARMQRYRDSQLTVKDFCQREGVSQPSFYHWKQKLADPPTLQPKFVPVTTTMLTTPKLILPGGASIELPLGLARDQLTELLVATIAATELASEAISQTAHEVSEARS